MKARARQTSHWIKETYWGDESIGHEKPNENSQDAENSMQEMIDQKIYCIWRGRIIRDRSWEITQLTIKSMVRRQISILPWRLPYPSSAWLSEESVGSAKLWLQVTQTKNRIILSLCVLTGLDKTRRCIKTTIMIQGWMANTRRTRQCPHRGHGMFEWAFKQSFMWVNQAIYQGSICSKVGRDPNLFSQQSHCIGICDKHTDSYSMHDSPLCVCFWIKQVIKLQKWRDAFGRNICEYRRVRSREN